MLIEIQSVEGLRKDNKGYIIFNNSIRLDLSDIPMNDWFVVDALTEDRFYLVSKAVYGIENYADLIMIYNNYNNPFFLPKGTRLRIPDLQYIQSKMLLFQQQNLNAGTANVIQRNNLTAKSNAGSNVSRSDGRLIFAKKN